MIWIKFSRLSCRDTKLLPPLAPGGLVLESATPTRAPTLSPSSCNKLGKLDGSIPPVTKP